MRNAQHAEPPGIAEYRQVMGLFATGVCVVSVPEGPHGLTAMTVNSLVSVSLDPMLLCWSLQNSSGRYAAFAEADRFAISILALEQAELARRYAAHGDSLLRLEDFASSPGGLPIVVGSMGHIECRRWSDYPAGDHTMILGEVTGLGALASMGEAGNPLGFFNGQFCSIAG
ncbi:flavin reductase family protein [Qipengyuania sp. ASV99]|uniref:flavin reductase family protein n=1 Tax=Qipengyuania sp. ASV99 TaxID=3399681 RepID=UPI003A4C7C1C